METSHDNARPPRDDACVAAMGTAQEFHATIGIDRVERRVGALATAVHGRAAAAGSPG
ncbi:MAG: hypothetical protein IH966_03700 [Gemmatimonadetes bacterium]|nr:hypothetical protein [Gemmatimonadota bacterium]